MERAIRRVVVTAAVFVTAVAGQPAPALAAATVRIWGAQSPNYCLTGLKNTYDVWTTPCGGGEYQNWVLVAGTNPNRTDDYRVVSATGQWNYCLEQRDSGSTFVWVAWCDGGPNQNWWISRQGTANRYKNESSLWCLDMSHVNGVPNGTITSWPCYDPITLNQQWYHG
ncbi:RICIN domain-containing protein [Actinoplanes rectilineatus]|nr:hypothetical protein [Actinoplanes rectilineatus]GLY06734.1 hypothetical protein Acsp01_71130 [Actinoplanes sp. NBRC 101535]